MMVIVKCLVQGSCSDNTLNAVCSENHGGSRPSSETLKLVVWLTLKMQRTEPMLIA
jgi:hypothetical protein